MAKSSIRAELRRLRQERNAASLTRDQKSNIAAAKQFVIFGGKRGKSQGRPYEAFVAVG